jgi:hypothetical protein
VNPKSLAASPQEFRVGPAWFVLAAVGVAVNFAGSWAWLGLGPALFLTGAAMVALAWGSVAFFLAIAVRWLAARASEQPADE